MNLGRGSHTPLRWPPLATIPLDDGKRLSTVVVVVGRVSEAPVATSLPLVWTIYVRNEWIVVQTDDGKDRMVVEDVVKEKDGERDAPDRGI